MNSRNKLAADSKLQELCKQYLSINLVYCWGIFLQTYAQRLLQAVGDTVLSMLSLIIGAVLNIILDPIMIFGLLGCPAMGVRGAAIATVIGQMTGAVSALLFNRFRNPIIHVHLKDYHFSWVPCLWIFIKISGISHGWYAFWIAELIACIYSYCMSHKLLKTIFV